MLSQLTTTSGIVRISRCSGSKQAHARPHGLAVRPCLRARVRSRPGARAPPRRSCPSIAHPPTQPHLPTCPATCSPARQRTRPYARPMPTAHTHTHTPDTDTQAHRHTDTQTRRHTDTQIHRHKDTQTHRHTDTQTHTYLHTQTRVHKHTHTHTRTRACAHTHHAPARTAARLCTFNVHMCVAGSTPWTCGLQDSHHGMSNVRCPLAQATPLFDATDRRYCLW